MEFQTSPMVAERQLDLKEAFATRLKTVDSSAAFARISRGKCFFQRRIKTEGHVPDLPGKNEQDRA